jgi:multidrug efflux system membrane fusion protein
MSIPSPCGRKRVSPRLVPAAGLALLAAAPLACSPAAAPPEPELRPVRYEVVSSVDAGRRRSFSGTCRPALEPSLSFKVDGTLARRPVDLGDRVERGTLIAELDPSDYQLQVEEAAAALRSAEAEARNAEARFSRIRGLYENGNASRTDYDSARAAAESGRAYEESVRKRLDLARQRLSYTRLVAPVAGAIARVSAEVNENVRAGQEVVLLAAEGGYEVEVTVPESLIGQIHAGQDARVTFDALPGRTLESTVTEVGVTSSSTGTAFPVKARLAEDDPGVRPGMAAEVEFRLDEPGEGARFRVPAHAVAEDRRGRFVLLVEPTGPGEGIVHRREVEVGALTPDGIEVLRGLEEGDRLVTAGISQLEDGDAVKLPPKG